MSCGCGGLPPSVLLRLEALKLADRDGKIGEDITKLAETYRVFLTGDLTDAQLNAPPKRAADTSSRVRNDFLQQPPSDLACDRSVLEKLAKHGVNQIGTLVQWQPHQLRDHAEFEPSDIEAVIRELAPHGLRLGLNAGQLRNWILHGTLESHGPSEA